jgi:prepilin-type N-terminal cleavage/methylation domain-containing protein
MVFVAPASLQEPPMLQVQLTPKRSSSARGFSLAEVLVAVALLSVIILALFGLVTAGVRQAYGGKKMTQATILAQSALERVNILKPQDLFSAVDTDTSITKSWTKTTAASVTPAAESGTSTAVVTRNALRTLLLNAELPCTPTAPATLSVTMSAQPTGKNFGNASMVRISLDVTWSDWGNRPRSIRLQTLNLRTVP